MSQYIHLEKGKIYHKIDWELILHDIQQKKPNDINLICNIAMARALERIYSNGITTLKA